MKASNVFAVIEIIKFIIIALAATPFLAHAAPLSPNSGAVHQFVVGSNTFL